MRALLTLTFFLFCKVNFSQTLLPEALHVQKAFEALLQNPSNQNSHKTFVESFPSNSKVFLKVFNPEEFDQLYSASDKYIDAIEQSASSFPKEVISKLVDIGKNLTWDADAVSHLQQVSVSLATKYPKLFVEKYKSLNEKEKDKLIKFYADVENHTHYKEYQTLINALKSIGSSDIAKSLEKAREERKKRKNH